MDENLKNFIAKQPIYVQENISIKPNSIIFPAKLDSFKLLKALGTNINSNTLTTEKALYVSSRYEQQPFLSTSKILASKLVFK